MLLNCALCDVYEKASPDWPSMVSQCRAWEAGMSKLPQGRATRYTWHMRTEKRREEWGQTAHRRRTTNACSPLDICDTGRGE